MSHNLKNKTVWITGGKRIGQSVAEELASLGANIVASYRSSREEAEELVLKAKVHNVKTLVLQCDVSNRESVIGAVEKIKSEFGQLDILVLMASIFKPVNLEDISDKDFQSNFDVHIGGTFWPIQTSLSLMKPGSHIITISDRTAIGKIYSGYLPYVVTKGAVASMTKALAVELGSKGIFVNSIAPGPILKPPDISDNEWQDLRNNSIIKYTISDEEAVQEFVDTVIRLCFVRSSGSVYPLDLGHL
ncbi:MAG: SDR family oxidoreductase [bacterium]|nr:SDR family oxidoreductase [bacterium]